VKFIKIGFWVIQLDAIASVQLEPKLSDHPDSITITLNNGQSISFLEQEEIDKVRAFFNTSPEVFDLENSRGKVETA
jgi:hypothetical protein